MSRFMEQQIGMIQTEHESGFRLEKQETEQTNANQKANQLWRRHPVPTAVVKMSQSIQIKQIQCHKFAVHTPGWCPEKSGPVT